MKQRNHATRRWPAPKPPATVPISSPTPPQVQKPMWFSSAPPGKIGHSLQSNTPIPLYFCSLFQATLESHQIDLPQLNHSNSEPPPPQLQASDAQQIVDSARCRHENANGRVMVGRRRLFSFVVLCLLSHHFWI